MKLNGIFFLVITTIILVAIVVMVHLEVSFIFIFYSTLVGQLLLIFTVYRVLTDNHKTDKTFDDWYEDHPVDKN